MMPHMFINPQHPNPRKTGRVIRCGLQARLDMGPHSIPRGATYPASLKPPDPHRDPGPGCVDHLHHHAPVALCDSAHNQGTPPAGCTTQHQAPDYLGCEPRSSDEALQTDEQITPITTIKQHTAAGRARHRPRSLKTARVEVRSSPGTSTATRNPRPTPTHPHSTRKSHKSAFAGSPGNRCRRTKIATGLPIP